MNAGGQVGAKEDKGDPCDLFGALTPPLADPGSDGQPELGGREGLDSNRHDNGGDGQMGQADAESDGQLIQADADPERSSARPRLAAMRLAVSFSLSLPPDASTEAPVAITPAAAR